MQKKMENHTLLEKSNKENSKILRIETQSNSVFIITCLTTFILVILFFQLPTQEATIAELLSENVRYIFINNSNEQTEEKELETNIEALIEEDFEKEIEEAKDELDIDLQIEENQIEKELKNELDGLIENNKRNGINFFEIGQQLTKLEAEAIEKNVSSIIPSPTNKIKVLLVARWRSGSTFTSSFLSAINNSYNVFEPLYSYINPPWQQGVAYEKLQTTESDENIYSNFIKTTFINYYYNFIPPIDTIRRFPSKNHWPWYSDNKGVYHQNLAVKKINSSSVLIAKTIRLRSLALLPKEIVEDDVNFKIIYLVRDPRGLANSRLRGTDKRNNHWNWGQAATIEKLTRVCETYQRFLNYRKNHHQTTKIQVVRYEDIAINPYYWAGKIYLHLGLKLNDPENQYLLDFIQQVTNSDTNDKITENSSKIAVSWIEKMQSEAIEVVQNSEECEKVFKAFGYKKIENSHAIKELKLKIASDDGQISDDVVAQLIDKPGCNDCVW